MKLSSGNFDSPSETRTFEHGHTDLVQLGDGVVGRATFEPGWRWSTSVKPIVGTESCQVHHVGYCLEGGLKVVTDDGAEAQVAAGDVYEIPPGHDAWVEGDATFVGLEFQSAGDYAKPS